MAKLPKQFFLELACDHGGETHGVRKLYFERRTDEGKITVQPVTYCGMLCGFCDVVARTVTIPSESAVTCGGCLKELEFRKGE